MPTMTFDEVIELLKQPPSIDRTLTYIERRRCWSYRPFNGESIDALPEHMRDIERACFNCGQKQPEHAGICWGNTVCQIWVCEHCAPRVQDGLQQPAAG